MQYKTGTADFRNGVATISFTGTTLLTNISIGDLIAKRGENASYTIGNVNSDTLVTLTSNYAGTTAVGSDYEIVSDFTPYNELAEIYAGDKDWPWHLTNGVIRKIDNLLGGVSTITAISVTTITAVRGIITSLTPGYLPKHTSDIVGFDDSLLYQTGYSLMWQDTANAKNTYGFTINQLAADDEIISLKSSDVAHSFTDLTEADTFMLIRKFTAANGGVFLRAFNDTDDSGLRLDGYIGVADPTDTTPAIIMAGGKLSGATVGTLSSSETVFQLRNWSTNLLTILGSGNVGIGIVNPSVPLQVDRTTVGNNIFWSYSGNYRGYCQVGVSGQGVFGLTDSAGTPSISFDGQGNSYLLTYNFGIGTSTFGTSADKVLAIGSGTAPTTSPADAAQLWTADHNGVAGYARLHSRPENVTYTPASPLALLSEVEMMSNPKAMSQGINYTAASAAAASITHDAKYANTTNSCGIVREVALPSWTPAANQILYQKLTGGAGEQLEIVATTGVIRYTLNATAYNSGVPGGDAASNLLAGSKHRIAAYATVGATTTVVTFYLDGKLLTTTAAQANVDLTNSATAYLFGTSAARYAGTDYGTSVKNRAYTATEEFLEYLVGVAAADQYGNQTDLLSGWDFTSGWNGGAATIDDANTYHTAAAGGPYRNGFINYELGKRYRFTITGTRSAAIALNYYTGSSGRDIGNTPSGSGAFSATIEFTANATDVSEKGIYIRNGSGASVDITSMTLVKIGATLALEGEGIQPNPGQWLDSSSNKLHAWQPSSGSSLVRKKDTFEVRGTNTWSGSHAAQSIGSTSDESKPILPVGCYITDIIGVISGANVEDIIIGDGSDTDRWVTITSGLSAGTTAFTITNRISDGTNYELVVDPDALCTMTIAFTIRGVILQ